MANEVVYVVFVALIIIISAMIWNRKVDPYTRLGRRQNMKYGGQRCSADNECQSGQMCVDLGSYMDAEGNEISSSDGICMSANEPDEIRARRPSRRPQYPHHGGPVEPNYPDYPVDPDNGRSYPSFPNRGPVDRDAAKKLAMYRLKGKGPAVSCASRCMSERGSAAECRGMCGLPSPPSSCMRRCLSERGTQAECQGICDPPTYPSDDGNDSPTWTFSMSGEISPSKVEGFGRCVPGHFWNANKGGCEPIYQGKSSAWYVNRQTQSPDIGVDIPGSTLPGYGVGRRDPRDKPTNVTISSN